MNIFYSLIFLIIQHFWNHGKRRSKKLCNSCTVYAVPEIFSEQCRRLLRVLCTDSSLCCQNLLNQDTWRSGIFLTQTALAAMLSIKITNFDNIVAWAGIGLLQSKWQFIGRGHTVRKRVSNSKELRGIEKGSGYAASVVLVGSPLPLAVVLTSRRPR